MKRKWPGSKKKTNRNPAYISGIFCTLIKKCSVIGSLHVRQQSFVLGIGEGDKLLGAVGAGPCACPIPVSVGETVKKNVVIKNQGQPRGVVY